MAVSQEVLASQQNRGISAAPAGSNVNGATSPRGQKRSSDVGVDEIDPEAVHADSDIVVNIDQETATGSGDGGIGADAAVAPPGADDEETYPFRSSAR